MLKKVYFFYIATLLLISCEDKNETEQPDYYKYTCDVYSIKNTNKLKDVNFFAYQIQDISDEDRLNELIESRYDLVVIEPTRTDVTGDADFDTKGAVRKLKASKGHDGISSKKVIAYIDIGEVEDWRWYWSWSKVAWQAGTTKPSDWPEFIVKPDPDGWTGNYPVAFWNENWKDIVIYGENTVNPYGEYKSILDEVIRDEFDGVYLDWVEGYEDSDVAKLANSEGLNASEEMMLFIKEIQAYGLSRNPGFIVIQQNAAELIKHQPDIIKYIDGIAQEAIWFDGFGGFDDWDDSGGYDVLNDVDLSNYYLKHLEKYQRAGLPVWCVEYALNNSDKAYSFAKEYCFTPYCTRRSLAKMTTTHPPGY